LSDSYFAADNDSLGTASATQPQVGLSIVIPVYRGERSVGSVVRDLAGLQIDGGMEIVLVNDGSPDGSAAVCQALLESTGVPMTYVEHARNFGEHNAVMTGLRHCRGAYVISMDDDGQNPADEVVRLYNHARQGNWDVVYAKYPSKKHALWRNLGSRFANKVADWLLDKPGGLYLSSFRCMSMLVVRGVTKYTGPYPYIDGLLVQLTSKIDSTEIRHEPRREGRSSYSIRKSFELWVNLATSFSLAPLRVAISLGMAMTILGALGAIATIAEALFRHDLPSGWASTMTVILIVSGTQSMILGVLGEYVGRILLSANGKPQSMVRKMTRNAQGGGDVATSLAHQFSQTIPAIAADSHSQAVL
jgi:glycosyltransferase involved in cell wall biosynthesis